MSPEDPKNEAKKGMELGSRGVQTFLSALFDAVRLKLLGIPKEEDPIEPTQKNPSVLPPQSPKNGSHPPSTKKEQDNAFAIKFETTTAELMSAAEKKKLTEDSTLILNIYQSITPNPTKTQTPKHDPESSGPTKPSTKPGAPKRG